MAIAIEEIALADVDLTDHARFAERVPHEMFAVLRREDPVHWQEEADGRGFWAITRHADITAVAKDWRTFSSELGGTLAPGSRARRARGAQVDDRHGPAAAQRAARDRQPRLHPARRAQSSPSGSASCSTRSSTRRSRRARSSSSRTSRRTCRCASSPRCSGRPRRTTAYLVDIGDRMLGQDDPEYAIDPEVAEANRHLPFSNPAALEMFEYGRKLADERRECPRDDIVTKLVEAEIDGCPLTQHEYDVYFLLLAVAGNETTRHSISQGLLALIENPDQLQRLRDEPGADAAGRERDPALGDAGPSLPPHRDDRHRVRRQGDQAQTTSSPPGTSRATSTRRSSTTPTRSTSAAIRTRR